MDHPLNPNMILLRSGGQYEFVNVSIYVEDDKDDEDYSFGDFFEFDDDINEDLIWGIKEIIERLGASSLREFGTLEW